MFYHTKKDDRYNCLILLYVWTIKKVRRVKSAFKMDATKIQND